ncbi:MAG: LPS export ABC transporter permease LptG [Sphingomonadaceae bacterium]
MMSSLFPSRTLTLYMGKMFVVRTFAVLAVLVLILQVLDLLSETDSILAYPGNGQAQIFTYVSLRLPQIIQRFLPFCVLLGTLITLATLNQNSEVVAMKAAGLSAHQVLSPLFAASIVIAAGSFVFNERVVTRSAATLAAWQSAEFGKMPSNSEALTNVWLREGDDLIHADLVEGRGAATRLTDVGVYDRSGGTLVRIITAPRARYVAGEGWVLEQPRNFDVASGSVTRPPTLTVARGVRPEQFTLAQVDGSGTPFWTLRGVIDDLARAGRPTAELEAAWWHKISGPLSTLLMPLLGAVAAFGLARSGKLFVRAVIGMMLGFAYFVADNFGLAMGNLGAYPPLLAAWGPFFLFLLVGEAVLYRSEE